MNLIVSLCTESNDRHEYRYASLRQICDHSTGMTSVLLTISRAYFSNKSTTEVQDVCMI